MIAPQMTFALETGKRYDFLCDDGQDIINAELIKEDREQYFVRLSAAMADIRIEKRYVRRTIERVLPEKAASQRWRWQILPGLQITTGRLTDFARFGPAFLTGLAYRLLPGIDIIARADVSRFGRQDASLNILRLATGAEYALPVSFWQISVAGGAAGGAAQIIGEADNFHVSSTIAFGAVWLAFRKKITEGWSVLLQPEISAIFDNRSTFVLAAFHAGVSRGF